VRFVSPACAGYFFRVFSFDGALGEVLVHPRSPADAVLGGLVAHKVGQCSGFPGPVLPILRGPYLVAFVRHIKSTPHVPVGLLTICALRRIMRLGAFATYLPLTPAIERDFAGRRAGAATTAMGRVCSADMKRLWPPAAARPIDASHDGYCSRLG
jgi:hypothetical protein